MDRVIIGVGPHKQSVTIEARDSREILRATGQFRTDARSYQLIVALRDKGLREVRSDPDLAVLRMLVTANGQSASLAPVSARAAHVEKRES